MRLAILVAAVLAATPSVATAQNMNAQLFHERATALKKKGAMAIFSRGEIKALMTEGQAAGLKAREHRLAAAKSGTKARFCPPEGKQSMDSTEFMKRLSAIPEAERRKIDMSEATLRILAAKYPCRG
ncbi:hypothetical protein [Sphingomonas arenae]|uniref:hypothetical protein n=1 Tax=Sphingomonas arenae TaxID=2812555 RepID=UPI001967898C|nr:hypothetical protein [Sphingomonas arenae]